jgi:lysophospholipase L1-like esterase
VLQPRSDAAHDLRKRLFSFSAASKDPVSFQRWWDYYRQEWDKMGSEIFKPDSTGKFPLRLRENARGELAESQIRINKHGFRGEDFEVEKGSIFRIVAIGESTTFGCTLAAGDRPWPELFEESINRQLHPIRPVQVINAGVPAYTLTHNVERLWQEILPLKPDLVVSYHGFNGFRMLDKVWPPVHGRRPPAYRKRPIKLLGDAEHRFRLRRWENSRAPEANSVARKEPMHTPYAQAYRQLIDTCRTNEIRLALATFSMAVNRESPREVVEFYRLCFPSVYAQIAANEAHSSIVRTLAREHPDVILIDTEPVLDGQHEFFIDLIHLTQEGRNKMAEAILQNLRPYIPKE